MACLWRAKLTLETLRRNFTAKITKPQNPRHQFKSSHVTQRPVFNFYRNQSQSFHNYSNSITKTSPSNLFFTAQRRFYCGNGSRFREANPLDMMDDDTMFMVIALGVLIGIYIVNRETIPYTKRTHFVTVPISIERWIGDKAIKRMKAGELKGKILSDTHPDSVRIQSISSNLIKAWQEGLSRHQESARTRHLEGLNWEILVVDDRSFDAYSCPEKVIVSSKLLKQFRTEDEMAVIIGHEVGHVVARHMAEKLTLRLWFVFLVACFLEFVFDFGLLSIPVAILFYFSNNSEAEVRVRDVVPPPYFRRGNEYEADHIGMILMASAGYDPRVAPGVYEKLNPYEDNDRLSTHPPGKKRARALAQPQKMDKALSLYREACSAKQLESKQEEAL